MLTLVVRDALVTALATAIGTYTAFRVIKYLYVRRKVGWRVWCLLVSCVLCLVWPLYGLFGSPMLQVANLRRENKDAVEADMRRIGEVLADQVLLLLLLLFLLLPPPPAPTAPPASPTECFTTLAT